MSILSARDEVGVTFTCMLSPFPSFSLWFFKNLMSGKILRNEGIKYKFVFCAYSQGKQEC